MIPASARTLFHIHTFEPGAGSGSWVAHVSIDPTHPIIAGHFPGRPVTPGVCMVQLVQELVGRAFQRPVRLATAKAIKFLSPLTPDTGDRMRVTIRATVDDHAGIHIDAQGHDGERPIFSLKAVFGPAS